MALNDDLETRFREGVFRRYGMKKGNLTSAISEAVHPVAGSVTVNENVPCWSTVGFAVLPFAATRPPWLPLTPALIRAPHNRKVLE